MHGLRRTISVKKHVLTVIVEQDEDGIFVVECDLIPGCISQGKTLEEALKNISDAIEGCLEVRAELGLALVVNEI